MSNINSFRSLSIDTIDEINKLTEQAKPKFLFDFLSSQKWIYKRPGNSNWIAYQDKLQQLLLEHKIHVAMRDDGTEKVCERVLITAKGLTKLAKIFELQQAA
ncbi:hypothetical protein BGK37_12335 [Pasteurella multocida]|nr:hypothetical protein BGK37_12335 [Pasteurella multocida]